MCALYRDGVVFGKKLEWLGGAGGRGQDISSSDGHLCLFSVPICNKHAQVRGICLTYGIFNSFPARVLKTLSLPARGFVYLILVRSR